MCLNFRHTGVVELEKLVFVLSGPDAHGGAGVLVEDAGDDIRYKGAPFLGAAHGHQVFLQQIENRAEVELRVFNEAKQ